MAIINQASHYSIILGKSKTTDQFSSQICSSEAFFTKPAATQSTEAASCLPSLDEAPVTFLLGSREQLSSGWGILSWVS
ncbi:uncharacterized protein [Phaseolus vulgaris]|uniref:uncharacterized protein n=1 Tax=Phaseolus vulgaris TaxID=3885 RepID=UPI0035CC7686